MEGSSSEYGIDIQRSSQNPLPPLLCWGRLVFATLVCSGKVSSWIFPASLELFLPFLSFFSLFVDQFDLRKRKRNRSKGPRNYWDCGSGSPSMGLQQRKKVGHPFSNTIVSRTLVVYWFSLTKAMASLEPDAMSSVSSGQ